MIAVQSYPELYTTLLGWQLYDQLWELLTQTGLAYLPLIGLILRHMAEPYQSQETKDAGNTSLRRMEVDFIRTLFVILFCSRSLFGIKSQCHRLHPGMFRQGHGASGYDGHYLRQSLFPPPW